MLINLELLGMLLAGFIIGYVARMVFVQCNKYRMLKRLVAFNAEFKEYHAAQAQDAKQ